MFAGERRRKSLVEVDKIFLEVVLRERFSEIRYRPRGYGLSKCPTAEFKTEKALKTLSQCIGAWGTIFTHFCHQLFHAAIPLVYQR